MTTIEKTIAYGTIYTSTYPAIVKELEKTYSGKVITKRTDHSSASMIFTLELNNNRQHWSTPDNFYNAANTLFDFQIDLAATAENTKCPLFISEQQDSLAQDTVWIPKRTPTGSIILRCWLNPPFKNIKDWICKAYNEAQKDPDALICVLCRVAPSAKWWMEYVTKAHQVLLIGGKRVQFEPPEGVKKSSNPQECCLVIFGKNDTDDPDPPTIYTWDWTKE